MGRPLDPVPTRVMVMDPGARNARPGAILRIMVGASWPQRLTIPEAETLLAQLTAAIAEAKALPPEPPRTEASAAALPAA